MNIQMQFCGLVILLLILVFYHKHDKVGLYTEKVFLRALEVTLLCVLLDIFSIVLINMQGKISETIIKLGCKTYLVSLVWTGFMSVYYACVDVYKLIRRNKVVNIFMTLAILFTVIIYLLPISIYNEDNMVYTFGLSVLATYFTTFFMVMSTVIVVFYKGKVMNPHRRRVVKLWMFIWMSASFLQFFFNEFLLVGFAISVCMGIMFFGFENPETSIDRMTGFFNVTAFSEYLKQHYAAKQFICGFLLSFDNWYASDIPSEMSNSITYQIIEFIRNVPNAKIFRPSEKEYALLFEDNKYFEAAIEIVKNRFSEKWIFDENGNEKSIRVSPKYIIVPSCEVAGSAAEMMTMLKYFRVQDLNMNSNREIIIDTDYVNKKREVDNQLKGLISAMDDKRIAVFFQPIYEVKSGKFTSAEALARIRAEDGSIIPPGLFIPIAEDTGMIGRLGEIVFRRTCRFIKKYNLHDYGIHYIEINLSVIQCENPNLAKEYISIMKEYDIDPSMINLEITESASIAMKKTFIENMNTLIDYGVNFSLDDFGNGQSNLNYIVDMPVQIIKFDRDMTQSYFNNNKGRLVMQTTLNMVHDMHLKVVAEGVETKEQLEEMERIGVDYVQGFYFSKPIQRMEFLEFLKEKNF